MKGSLEVISKSSEAIRTSMDRHDQLVYLFSKAPQSIEWQIDLADIATINEFSGTFPDTQLAADTPKGSHLVTLNLFMNRVERVDRYSFDYKALPPRMKKHVPDQAKDRIFKLEIESRLQKKEKTQLDQSVLWTVETDNDPLMYMARLAVTIDPTGKEHSIDLFIPKSDIFARTLDYTQSWQRPFTSSVDGRDHQRGKDILGYWVGQRNLSELVGLLAMRIEGTIASPLPMTHPSLPAFAPVE